MKQERFVVEGHYLDPEDGSITGDWILAETREQAAKEVTDAREHNCNGWEIDRVTTFYEYVGEQERIIEQMRNASDAEIAKGWTETKAYLVGDSRQDEAEELGRKLARKDGH